VSQSAPGVQFLVAEVEVVRRGNLRKDVPDKVAIGVEFRAFITHSAKNLIDGFGVETCALREPGCRYGLSLCYGVQKLSRQAHSIRLSFAPPPRFPLGNNLLQFGFCNHYGNPPSPTEMLISRNVYIYDKS
jgi:hypothetical protein